MLDQQKIDAVRDYLEVQFPGCTVEDRYDSDRTAQVFRISCQGATHVTVVLRTFLDAHETTDIPITLEGFYLAEHLRDLGETPVIVTNAGLEL